MAESDSLRPKLYCPECRVGKTVNCVGQALDPETDEFVLCSTEVKRLQQTPQATGEPEA